MLRIKKRKKRIMDSVAELDSFMNSDDGESVSENGEKQSVQLLIKSTHGPCSEHLKQQCEECHWDEEDLVKNAQSCKRQRSLDEEKQEKKSKNI